MVSAEGTALTERQLEVLRLRERGFTQREVAERIGTTDANVSAVERAAERNVEQARRTLEVVRVVRSPVRFSVEAGTYFEELVEMVYDHGDEVDVKVDYSYPELYAHLYEHLEDQAERSHLGSSAEIALTEDGDVRVFADPVDLPE